MSDGSTEKVVSSLFCFEKQQLPTPATVCCTTNMEGDSETMFTQTKCFDRDLLLNDLRSEFGADAIAPLIEANARWMKTYLNETETEWYKDMISCALGRLNEEDTYWTFVAARIYLYELYSQRSSPPYTNFLAHFQQLAQLGFYDETLLDCYSQDELLLLGNLIVPERDKLFTYLGLRTMMDHYIATNAENEPIELPQERWLITAMTLMQNETEERLKKVAEAYWALSHLYMTFEMPSRSSAIGHKVATYLPVYHQDIFNFLDNSSDGKIGISIPDLFMERVESRGHWHLFDPQEVHAIMGYYLEDFYDEKRGSGSFREKYMECVNHPELHRETVFAIDLMKRILRSQLETGLPHLFYRDEVNRKNVNKHVRCSQPPIQENPDCPQSSINLGLAVPAGVLERLIPIQVRMLDNAIDLNNDVDDVNTQFRGISLSTIGWHHLLAVQKIRWESTEAVTFADELYEQIAYLTISTSMALAKEKGAYPLFTGSDWHTGTYFVDRKYNSTAWQNLRADVSLYGVRNGYLTVIAANSSLADLTGTTNGVEPIIEKSTVAQQTNTTIPVIVPDLSPETFWFYKSAYFIDQQWTLKQNAARQRHIDQCISLKLYVPHTIQATELLNLHLNAWKSGLKMTNTIHVSSDFPSFLISIV